MNKVFEFLDKYLMRPMGILSQKQFVRAIMAAGMATIPFTIVGSAFLILGILPQAFPFLEGVWAVSFDKINALYMLANRFTMGVLALYFNIVMGFELTQIKAQEYKLNLAPLNGALLGMMAFLMTMAELTIADGGVFTLKEGENYINGVLYGDFASRLGSSGIFVGILMATLAVFLYKECVRRNWTIKLPDVVPSGVSRSFTALIPCFVIAFVVLILNGLLICIGYDLFTIVSVPFGFVANIADTWYGVFIINFLISALWSVGIHGANIISAFYSPITLANLDTNMKIMQGASGEYTTFAGEFQNMYVVCGGSGATLGMCIWMCFCAKSEQLSVLGKASIGPALFNINEPLVFGVPIIYNPNLIIPFILAPSLSSVIAYFAIHSGMFPPVIANVPWPTPALLGGFIGTANLMGGLLALITVTFAFLIYWPFLKAYDKSLVKQEKEMAEAEAQAETA